MCDMSVSAPMLCCVFIYVRVSTNCVLIYVLKKHVIPFGHHNSLSHSFVMETSKIVKLSTPEDVIQFWFGDGDMTSLSYIQGASTSFH